MNPPSHRDPTNRPSLAVEPSHHLTTPTPLECRGVPCQQGRPSPRVWRPRVSCGSAGGERLTEHLDDAAFGRAAFGGGQCVVSAAVEAGGRADGDEDLVDHLGAPVLVGNLASAEELAMCPGEATWALNAVNGGYRSGLRFPWSRCPVAGASANSWSRRGLWHSRPRRGSGRGCTWNAYERLRQGACGERHRRPGRRGQARRVGVRSSGCAGCGRDPAVTRVAAAGVRRR
jgi:hypothetical protein